MSIRRSLVFSLAERYLTSAAFFVAAVINARLLTPAEVGVFTVGISIIGVTHAIRDFGMAHYIVQEKELTPARYRTAAGLTIAISAVFGALLWFGSGAIARFYGDAGLVPVVHVLALGLFVASWTTPAMAKLQRQMDFRLLLQIGGVAAVLGAIVSVSLAFAGASSMSLAWGSLCVIVSTAVLLAACRWSDVAIRPTLSEWKRVFPFGLQSAMASVSSSVGTQAAGLIIGRVLDLGAVGLYGRAQGLVGLFSRDIGPSIYRVLMPGFAETHRAGHDVKERYLKSVVYMTSIAWPIYGFLAIAAEPVIEVLFGAQWVSAAPVARVLCIVGAVHATWATSSQVIVALGHIGRILRAELMVQPTRLVLILLGAQVGLVAVAWAQVVTSVVGGTINLTQLVGLLRLSLADILRACVPGLTVTVGPLVVGVVTRRWLIAGDHGVIAQVVATGAAFGLAWITSIVLTRHPVYHELMRVVHRIRERRHTAALRSGR